MKWYEIYYRIVVVCCICFLCACTGCRSSRHATRTSSVETHSEIRESERVDSVVAELCKTDTGRDTTECVVTGRGRIEIRRDSLGNPCTIEWNHRIDRAVRSSMSTAARQRLSLQNVSHSGTTVGTIHSVEEETEETKTDIGTTMVTRWIISILTICVVCYFLKLWRRS